MSKAFISVIIPTYKDWNGLLVCIEALSVQTYPKESYEIIVADNNPIGEPPLLPPYVIYIKETKPGSYAARNAALRIAKGKIIAFTDSDCIPDKYWLEKGLECVTENNVNRVAGKVELYFDKGKHSAAASYEKAFAFDQLKNVANGVSVTANLFVKRELFDQLGVFDSSLMSGGDVAWNKKAHASGDKIVYCSYSFVKHPARATMEELNRKTRRVASSARKFPVKKIITSLLPPIRLIQPLKARKDMSPVEKIEAWVVAYWLKVYSAVIVILVICKFKSPTRM